MVLEEASAESVAVAAGDWESVGLRVELTDREPDTEALPEAEGLPCAPEGLLAPEALTRGLGDSEEEAEELPAAREAL